MATLKSIDSSIIVDIELYDPHPNDIWIEYKIKLFDSVNKQYHLIDKLGYFFFMRPEFESLIADIINLADNQIDKLEFTPIDERDFFLCIINENASVAIKLYSDVWMKNGDINNCYECEFAFTSSSVLLLEFIHMLNKEYHRLIELKQLK